MITREQILAGLEEILESRIQVDKVPDGWMTLKQLADLTDRKSASYLGKVLRRAVHDGTMPKPRKFKVSVGKGKRVVCVPHYFVAKKSP